MLACKICSRTSDRDREIENLREDREAILTIDARESKEECCDAWRVLARHHDDCKSSLRSMGVTSRHGAMDTHGVDHKITHSTISKAKKELKCPARDGMAATD